MRRLDPRARRVLGFALLLAVAGATAALWSRPAGLLGLTLLPWWVLAVMFAATESISVRTIWFRSGAGVTTLSGIPLVLGLALAEPWALLAGATVASCAVGVVVRRKGVLRAVFRTALAAAQVAAGVAVFRSVLGDGVATASELRLWPAAALAAVAAGALEIASSVLVAGWYHDDSSLRQTALRVAEELVQSLVVGVVGVFAVLAFNQGDAAAWPLAVSGVAGLLGLRVFGLMADRHASLNRIHELSGDLAAAEAFDEAVRVVVGRSVALVSAGYGEVVLGGVRPGVAVRWTARSDGSSSGPEPINAAALPQSFPPSQLTPVSGASIQERNFLISRGVQAALVVPLSVDERVNGYLLVADHNGEDPDFARRDARLLETVANQASLALRNGRLVEQLRHEARHDELTGLPNRFELNDRLDRAAIVAGRGDHPIAVMVLDFDGFKAINDTLGHQAGDELLKVLAGRLDQVGSREALVARLGGDEFAVLASCRTEADAVALARRLLGVFEEPVEVAGSRLRLAGSLGIALGPRHGVTGSDLMRSADIAMYSAKSSGGGFKLFTEDLVRMTASGLNLASDLRDALANDEVRIAVQPIVELATGNLHSLEVLARWKHPEYGEIAPEAFFQAAERSGQAGKLSGRILDKALQAARGWLDAGTPVQVAVNLSPRWLSDQTLPDQLRLLLEKYGLPGSLLCVEITENGVIADHRRAAVTLAQLREMDISLSVDDFGTGYSSLAYLSRLPITQMKIDKSFVERMNESARELSVVKSIIDLGRNMHLEVVAEGVTDGTTLAALRDMGCQLGQGYLFSTPIPVEEMTRHLLASRRPVAVPEQRRDVDVADVPGVGA